MYLTAHPGSPGQRKALRIMRERPNHFLHKPAAPRRRPGMSREGAARAGRPRDGVSPQITILMRCTYRPEQCGRAVGSVIRQAYENWRLILSYDDDRCLEYLRPYRTHPNISIVKSIAVDRSRPAFYNLYMNPLIQSVSSGWIIVLDDDDMLTSPGSLLQVARQLSSPDVLVTWSYRRGKELVEATWRDGIVVPGTIASCSYCVHSSRARRSRWTTGQRGDYAFLYGVLRQGRMDVRRLPTVLTKSVRHDQLGGNFGAVEEPASATRPEAPSFGKISIVMPYYNRKKQALATLKQFERLYAGKYDFEVIIVDDVSDAEERLTNVQSLFPFSIKYVQLENKTWINPVVPLNVGISNVSAGSMAIVLQSPEVFHCGDVLAHLASSLTDENYIVYPVFDSPTYEANNHLYGIAEGGDGVDYVASFVSKWETSTANADRVKPAWKGWLQHPVHNDRQLHFLSAITKRNMDMVGGFCDEMRDGLWYEDDDFLNRVKQIATVTSVGDPIAVHLKHAGGSGAVELVPDHVERTAKNKEILNANLANGIVKVAPPANSQAAPSPPDLSIVMAYYNRKPQTLETLKGFERSYAGKHNFEVVIVDDNSDAENRLEEDIQQFSFPINLIVISAEEKGDRINPCAAFNKGFAAAAGEIIMIQTPECYHVGDVLKHAMDNLGEQDYFSYSCFTANSSEITQEVIESDPMGLTKDETFLARNVAVPASQTNWYNHAAHHARGGRNIAYGLCSAIHKSKLELIGGFDKRFAGGYCFEIDQLLLAVKYNLKLDIQIIEPKTCFIVHQYHTSKHSSCFNEENEDHPVKRKWLRNKRLLENMESNHLRNDFAYPKLLHLYWDRSPLSYLNYLTVVSFNKYNPDWKIIVSTPTKKTEGISWKTNEQELRYTGRCYFGKLHHVDNVVIQQVCLDQIGFDNNASECVKSDYFRYHILKKHGGLWSDFDVIYTNSVEEKLNFKENTVIFRCTGYHNLETKTDPFVYYPIGLFVSKPNSLFFRYVLDQCRKYCDESQYQAIGASMFNDLFKSCKEVHKIDQSIKILDNRYYLPWQCNELEEFIVKRHNLLPRENVGIHWFNGGGLSKQYSIDLDKRLQSFSINSYLDKFVSRYLKQKNVGIFSESSYPGGGGEEFLYDLAVHFHKRNYNVWWFSLHKWGGRVHDEFLEVDKGFYTEVRISNRQIGALSNFDHMKGVLTRYNINYLIHQGRGHKLICDIGNELNIPAITFWCFWEEALDIDWSYGLMNINKNLDKHKKNDDFLYITDNVDYFYFASRFVKETIESKYNVEFDDEHVLPTLSCGSRLVKDYSIDSFNSEYVTLLDAHTLKGADILSELVLLNPEVSFLAIKTEDEENGPGMISKSMNKVSNGRNRILSKRVDDVREIYNQTRIVLCPTRLDETFCRVVYEAFQNRIPVIFSSCGNLGFIENPDLLCIEERSVEGYNSELNRLLCDRSYYQKIVDLQYSYYRSIKSKSDLSRVEDKLLAIENTKNRHVGIFTPWCDQGLGIQSRIYKHLLEGMGYKCFIFATRPYVESDKDNLRADPSEWETSNIYRSPNRRLEVSFGELDLFVSNYKIKKFLIPEIQYELMFEIPLYLREKYNISSYAIPNVENVRGEELCKFDVFDRVLANNRMSYEILTNRGLHNVSLLGFHYAIPPQIKAKEIQNKRIESSIQILHLTGLNGLFRKRTTEIVRMFDKLYQDGVQFELNIGVQGNFDEERKQMFNKPFINLIDQHLSYSEILNLYNRNHISIQLSKHEGLGLGFYESCCMGTPVITLDSPPHNEVIHDGKNGWLLSCTREIDRHPENPSTIVKQTQINEQQVLSEIRQILLDKEGINNVIMNTKSFTEKLHSYGQFENNIKFVF